MNGTWPLFLQALCRWSKARSFLDLVFAPIKGLSVVTLALECVRNLVKPLSYQTLAEESA